MTRAEKLVFLSLLVLLVLGAFARLWQQKTSSISWQVKKHDPANLGSPFTPNVNTLSIQNQTSAEYIVPAYPESSSQQEKKQTRFRTSRNDAKKSPQTISTNLININTASLKKLETLPSIGKVTAQRILNYRHKNGPFKEKNELLNIPKFRLSSYKKIESLITVSSETP